MKSRDQSSGVQRPLRGCQFDRSVGGIEGDGLLKPASEDLLRPSCRASAEMLEAGLSREIRRRLTVTPALRSSSEPPSFTVLLVKAHLRASLSSVAALSPEVVSSSESSDVVVLIRLLSRSRRWPLCQRNRRLLGLRRQKRGPKRSEEATDGEGEQEHHCSGRSRRRADHWSVIKGAVARIGSCEASCDRQRISICVENLSWLELAAWRSRCPREPHRDASVGNAAEEFPLRHRDAGTRVRMNGW